jgi:hypothetical protein
MLAACQHRIGDSSTLGGLPAATASGMPSPRPTPSASPTPSPSTTPPPSEPVPLPAGIRRLTQRELT